MRNLKITSLIFALSSLSTFAAVANDNTMSNFSYDFVEAKVGISPVLYGIGISRSIHPNAHIRAEIESEFESDFDSTIAAAFHSPINDWADAYGEIGMKATQQPGIFNGETKLGIEVTLGIRQWLAPQIEIAGEIGHYSINKKDDFFGSIFARYHATELFAIGLQGRFNEFYGDQVVLNTRFKY